MSARFCILLTASLWVAGSLGAKDDQKNDKDKLQGDWTVASMELRGKMMGEEERKHWKLVVKGDEWRQTFKGDELKMTFKVDPSKSPKEIDFQFTTPEGKEWTLKGIYKLDGDTLTVCKRNENNEDRPKELKAGDSTLLAVFKRAEKK
jgi:uncharacterized protein (TIGR03067 family)